MACAGGLVVGLLTNWIALKCIFEPVVPITMHSLTPLLARLGREPFVLHGRFMKRQDEVGGAWRGWAPSAELSSGASLLRLS